MAEAGAATAAASTAASAADTATAPLVPKLALHHLPADRRGRRRISAEDPGNKENNSVPADADVRPAAVPAGKRVLAPLPVTSPTKGLLKAPTPLRNRERRNLPPKGIRWTDTEGEPIEQVCYITPRGESRAVPDLSNAIPLTVSNVKLRYGERTATVPQGFPRNITFLDLFDWIFSPEGIGKALWMVPRNLTRDNADLYIMRYEQRASEPLNLADYLPRSESRMEGIPLIARFDTFEIVARDTTGLEIPPDSQPMFLDSDTESDVSTAVDCYSYPLSPSMSSVGTSDSSGDEGSASPRPKLTREERAVTRRLVRGVLADAIAAHGEQVPSTLDPTPFPSSPVPRLRPGRVDAVVKDVGEDDDDLWDPMQDPNLYPEVFVRVQIGSTNPSTWGISAYAFERAYRLRLVAVPKDDTVYDLKRRIMRMLHSYTVSSVSFDNLSCAELPENSAVLRDALADGSEHEFAEVAGTDNHTTELGAVLALTVVDLAEQTVTTRRFACGPPVNRTVTDLRTWVRARASLFGMPTDVKTAHIKIYRQHELRATDRRKDQCIQTDYHPDWSPIGPLSPTAAPPSPPKPTPLSLSTFGGYLDCSSSEDEDTPRPPLLTRSPVLPEPAPLRREDLSRSHLMNGRDTLPEAAASPDQALILVVEPPTWRFRAKRCRTRTTTTATTATIDCDGELADDY